MKTYAVPVAYFISDDNEVIPSVYIIKADNLEQARELTRFEIIAEELEELPEEEDFDCIPSIWLEEEEGDEEGYIIGKNVKEI